ncbi:DNA alkylation repair protein [Candidatus Falkowbacteria bacterium RIFOXYB2_FULL_38_15]|uniref:DNA alkylation repair protein n=1 Tax=Candidatus Falkowbacteria bacterium RIFOXYA2_FULL_38_12 TaxID=1797993 RepID=A0A1F5S1B1_9BACT|nr:MAG: DNA alkylation repair protein [Candidatus Falkowbacteria bacterium RIFOXYA2_FULL_38_12]OGF32904.1 MAG: DNA alkylation repair protein [Candidatus Falkowbacteria bacterium RIFOXYB2_FULL_38_15]OGF44142.1 MAG: DNA alkylation repair protein [Candidatus Falkowbacteria bacterium RIFOXYD2_FULL_39_16]
MPTLNQLKKELRSLGSPEKAKGSARFFKTAKGEYGEGDVFIGVTVPRQREVAKKYRDLSLSDIIDLLQSREHEFRLTALFVMVSQFKKGGLTEQEEIYRIYISNIKWINNWDLVDSSAPDIVGKYLLNKDPSILFKLARSRLLWDRRVAMLATFTFIREGKPEIALEIAEILLHDKHDLIHKAVGWMLREVGKKYGIKKETEFLDKHYREMPRTMLRYAIEKFPEKLRKHYLG